MAGGTSKCWGNNGYGQLGNNSTTRSLVPVPVSEFTGLTPATTAVNVNTGGSSSCAVMEDGSVRCWGIKPAEWLGANTLTRYLVPVSVADFTGLTPATTAVNVTTGSYHSCAVMADGTAKCWGSNSYGQLGNNSTTRSLVPVPVSGITNLTAATRVTTGSSGRTLAAAPGAPGVPIIGARTTTSVAISWAAAAGNGSEITNYVVEYRKGTGAWTTFTRPAPSSALSVNVTGLEMGGSYTFRVSAVSAGGTGPTSVVSAAALAASAPSAPGSLAGAPTTVAGQIKVTWKAALLNGAPSATYKVSWLVGTQWTTPITASGSTYAITNLKPGTYSVRVTATTVEGSTTATKTGIRLLR